MEPDKSTTCAVKSKMMRLTAAGQLPSQKDNLLAALRLRRRRQKLVAPFKTYSGALYLIPSSAGVVDCVDENSTNNVGYSNSSLDTKIGESTVEALPEVQRKSCRDIVTVINSCLELVFNMSNDVNIVAKHLFGRLSFHRESGNYAGTSSDGEQTDTQVEVANGCVPSDGYETRLQSVEAYLSKEESNLSNVSTDLVPGLEDRNRHASEQIAQSTNSTTEEEAATGFEKPVVIQNKTESISKTPSPAKSQVQTVTSNRTSNSKRNCRIMLQGITSLVKILKLALEGNRTVERAMTWVKTHECELPEGIIAVVSDTACETSQSVSNALSEAEEAVMIYEEFKKGYEELSSCNNKVIEYRDNIRHTVDTDASTFEDVGQLVRMTTDISLNRTDRDSAVNSTKSVEPWSQNDVSNGSYDEIPSEAYETLLRATERSLCAMDAALTVLEILSVAEFQMKATNEES